jgi:hypothetical protein
MTRGVDVNGNENPNGKKFLFTIAAGNVVPNFDFCHTFPAILGPGTDGVVTIGGLTRENTWWPGSCANELVEVVARAESPVLASITTPSRYRGGAETSGTSFAALRRRPRRPPPRNRPHPHTGRARGPAERLAVPRDRQRPAGASAHDWDGDEEGEIAAFV